MYGRYFIKVNDAQQRMQFWCPYMLRKDIRIVNLQYLLHIDSKDKQNSAKLVDSYAFCVLYIQIVVVTLQTETHNVFYDEEIIICIARDLNVHCMPKQRKQQSNQ